MENLILVIIFALIGLVKWIIENRAKSSPEETRREIDQPERKPAETLRPAPTAETPEEERMRRFMEALGLPGNDAPPPTARRAAKPPVTPPQTVQEPLPRRVESRPPQPRRIPGETGRWGNHPAPAKRKVQTPQPAPVAPSVTVPNPDLISTPGAAPFKPLDAFPEIPDAAPTSSVAPPMEIASLEIKQKTSSKLPPGSKTIDTIRGELRDPAALRRAFVLREILGPPLAMKS